MQRTNDLRPSPGSQAPLQRRNFLRAATAIGFAGPAVLAPSGAAQQQGALSGSATASRRLQAVDEINNKARQALDPICRGCKQCDGVACAGEYPGLGGIGSGVSFQNNFLALKRLQLKLRTLTNVATVEKKPDTSVTIFGQKLSFPAIAAPVGGLANVGNRMAPDKYFDAIIGGCVDAGTAGAIGDEPTAPDALKIRYDVIARYEGRAFACIKPRPNPNYLSVLPMAEASGAFMVGIDVDSAARYGGARAETQVGTKTPAQLRELIRASKRPLVVKGIMTPEEALAAVEAGAPGIVVSNHGGRVLDHTPGTAEVLPAIADAVKGKTVIFVDGCVHYGVDVLKYLALGADAVLVGRHLVKAAFGGGREGVALYMRTMRDELEAAMVMTGVPSVDKVSRRILV